MAITKDEEIRAITFASTTDRRQFLRSPGDGGRRHAGVGNCAGCHCVPGAAAYLCCGSRRSAAPADPAGRRAEGDVAGMNVIFCVRPRRELPKAHR
ncbi:MAG: hypothetical protein ABI277_04435 [Burkholderiaceae bacterium]